MSETSLLHSAGGLTYRLKEGSAAGSPIVMLHGLTGDESVMWTFQSALPSDRTIAAPRAPFESPLGGYSWVEDLSSGVRDYGPSSRALAGLVDELGQGRPILVGFSQGAGLAFAACALRAVDPVAIVALSGFLPPLDLAAMHGRPIYWAHGLRDERVPIERARGDVARLRSAGASVELCESDVGHKVSVDCLRGLRTWLVDAKA